MELSRAVPRPYSQILRCGQEDKAQSKSAPTRLFMLLKRYDVPVRLFYYVGRLKRDLKKSD